MSEHLSVVVPAFNEEKYILNTLESLHACNPPQQRTNFLVIDNGSTDNTAATVQSFLVEHPNFPLTIIEEVDKGTGIACNTGFRYSIDHFGAGIIARTDSDTLVSTTWLQAIENAFQSRPEVQLLTGPVHPLQDEWYRPVDGVAFPLSRVISRMLKELALPTIPSKRLLTPGNNMATRAMAYEMVDGFPPSSIDTTNEDIEFRNKTIEMFGVKALKFSSEMVVATSMRRIRQVGYRRLFSYYVNNQNQAKRLKASRGIIDVR